MARGGRRAGQPGRAYGQRTDLNANKPLPIQTATGQPYGVAGAQAAGQRAVPLAPSPSPTGSPETPSGPARVQPGSLGSFDRGTERPNEHVLTPAPIMTPDASGGLGVYLAQLGQTNQAIAQLAAYVNSGKQ